MTSCQEFTEFENEFKLKAKLQHRNQTKLLGVEKFLVCEFRSNNSLQKVIFGMKSYITFILFTIVRVILILKKKEIWDYSTEIEYLFFVLFQILQEGVQ